MILLRILVVSDAHGRVTPIEEAIERTNADVIMFLGDGLKEIEDLDLFYPDKTFHFVCGNCDFSSNEPATKFITICGKKIMMTHGHVYNVKYTLETLKSAARQNGVDIVLFGHTHNPLSVYEDGLYILNPGSIGMGEQTYGVIDFASNGVMTFFTKL